MLWVDESATWATGLRAGKPGQGRQPSMCEVPTPGTCQAQAPSAQPHKWERRPAQRGSSLTHSWGGLHAGAGRGYGLNPQEDDLEPS